MSEVGAALRAARTAAGISLQGMAARTNYSKPYLGQLETGARVVRAEHVTAYESALRTRLGDLRDRLTIESVNAEFDDLPGQLSSLLLPPVPQTRRGDHTGFATTDLADAERLATWARARQWGDGPEPRRAVVGWLTANLPRLPQLSADSGNDRALRVGAELADIAAAMSWDGEDMTAARRYSIAAAHAARAAGDTELTAAILAESAWQLLDNGRPAQGLEVIQFAQYLARRTATPMLRLTLAELEAYAHGVLGERAAFRRAIVVAAECRAEVAESEVRGTAADRCLTAATVGMILGPRRDWPGPGQQWRLLGHSYRDLIATRPDLARIAFGDVRAPLPRESVPPTMSAISSARLQLMLGEPEYAAEQIVLALSLCEVRPVGRTAARLSDFLHESAEFAAVAAVGEVRTTIRELVAH
ncbi:helix-turn-helix domain-containing protein [Nocardia aurea]|uniref:Helix-turn-helix domain-containing protein n=1 Tax=Nocardia aurea TaxID=2144174 RepID=A0ABV3FKY0_9NOCA